MGWGGQPEASGGGPRGGEGGRALVRGAAGEAVRHAAPLAATARAGKRPKRQPMARVGRLLSDACRAERLALSASLPRRIEYIVYAVVALVSVIGC